MGEHKVIEVCVSHVTDDGKLFACNSSDKPALDSLMIELQTYLYTFPPLPGDYTPKIGDICAGKLNDSQWCRAKIEKISANKVYVHFIDYGHSTFVEKTKLAALPGTYANPEAYVKKFCIALVRLPKDEQLAAIGVGLLQHTFVACRTVKLKVEYVVGSDTFVSVHFGDEDVVKKLVEDGLLLVDRQADPRLEKLVKEYEEAMDRAKKNCLNIWRNKDNPRDDSVELAAACKRLSLGGFGFVDQDSTASSFNNPD